MDDAVIRYLTHLTLRGLAPGTITARRRFLRRLERALGVPLTEAAPAMLTAWRTSLTCTPAVISTYVSHASCFFTWAVAEGLCPANPAAGIPVPRAPRRLPRPISEADLMAAIAQAPPRIRLWLILAAWAGLRACEVAGLRAENIVLRADPPVILVAWDATKGIRERAIPLCPFAVAELAAAGLPARGWAFGRMDGRAGPNKPHRVSHVANDYLRDCGIPATLHQLRHRFGTETYRASRDLRAVQDLMGHADPATTAIYTAVSQPSAIAAVAALPVPQSLAGLPAAA
jgi:integrase/recombinase XerC